MTQGKWILIHKCLRVFEFDAYILSLIFEWDVRARVFFLFVALILSVGNMVADGLVRKKLIREGRFIGIEDVPLDWDLKGCIIRGIGALVILLVLLATLGPDIFPDQQIQILPVRLFASPWFKGAAVVLFDLYFCFVAYESYARNYASERRSKSEDGYKTRPWEE